ncbi:MAG: hypothetical protein ACU843_05895 [Gammaproteobacteria bacterium]
MQPGSLIRFVLYFSITLAVSAPVLAESEYPAAYFQPYIVYQAPEIAGKPESSGASEAAQEATAEVEEDPYPAAYFQPVIVYQDQERIAADSVQKAPEPAPVTKRSGPAPAAKPAAAQETAPITADGGFPSSVLLLLVAVIGGCYWFLMKNKSATVAEETSSPETGDAGTEEEAGEPTAETEQVPEVS